MHARGAGAGAAGTCGRRDRGGVGAQLADVAFPLVPRGRIVGLAFGALRSARRGRGSDVAGSRPYVAGDQVEAIDWAATARLSTSHGGDEFVVREQYAEEAPRVVVVCDRRPEMQLAPPGFPWLRKSEAERTALELIRASTVEAHGFVGYLDFGDGGDEPFWLPPQTQSLWEYEDREVEGTSFAAPSENVVLALEFLTAHPRSVPAGTFVFVLSDFLAPPPRDLWTRAIELRWDVVPVVLQDPLWERSFPPVHSFVLSIADAGGAADDVWLSRREAEERRREHEARWTRLLDDFRAVGLDPVIVASADPQRMLQAFLAWSDERRAEHGW